MKRNIVLLFLFFCFFAYGGVIKKKDWQLVYSEKGYIERIVFKTKSGYDTIPFFTNDNAGPAFYARLDGKDEIAKWIPNGWRSFCADIDGVECILKYREYHGSPAVEVTLTNRSHVPFQPEKAGLKSGIDTYMDKYPVWNHKYFPTLMRCEKTHFYGYLQTPLEHTLALVSEQPIASWSVDYNLGYMDPAPHWFMGHRIESLNLDLLNALPLPDRHPQHLYELAQGESKTWIIAFVNVGELNDLEQKITAVESIPMIDAAKTSYRPQETATCMIWAKNPSATLRDDDAKEIPVSLKKVADNRYAATCELPQTGLYTLTVQDGGKQAEAVLTVPHTWRWTLEKARENALRYHQKASSHIESWYGFYSAFIAARYFPDKKLDAQLDDRFEYLFCLLHDTVEMKPRHYAFRIQNTAGTIGLLVDRYEAKGDIRDLERASRLGDWLMRTSQREDGAYYNHGTKYTSVIYIAKSMLELTLAEQEAGKKDPRWEEAAGRHFESARRAVDELVRSQGNFETEGEMTFEDGMVSCSALQIGMLALFHQSEQLQGKYARAMLDVLNSHNCLTQLKVPDARRRQGTMRYWEAQYDVQMLPNMFNSPHGWSGWRAYAVYYAYLLTGEEKWLQQTFNAMGAFANLIDYRTGNLRWAFVVDPHLQVEQACSPDRNCTFDSLTFGNPHPHLYDTRKVVIGEQYVNMISDWQPVNTQDNDVHELFKCMGETVLTNAFIIEREDGSVVGYNCRVKRQGNRLEVMPFEKQMIHLHYNLKRPFEVVFNGKTTKTETERGWIN